MRRINKLVILLFVITGLSAAEGTNCSKHPIYCQILKNKPEISREYAMKLSKLITKISNKYKINTRIFTAILAQESMFSLDAKNCQEGMIKKSEDEIRREVSGCVDSAFEEDGFDAERCTENIKKFRKDKICFDFGIGQINYRMAEILKIDIDRLITDLEYSIEMSAKMLSTLRKQYEEREPIDYWTRYNSSTRDIRDEYEKQVKRRM